MSRDNTAALDTTAARYRRASLWLALAGFVALLLADLEITTRTPGAELGRMGLGFLTPDFFGLEDVWRALANTLAFAFQGVAMGAVGGFLLALAWGSRGVRALCAVLRAVHELFWGLLFLQVFGLSVLTGVLAIGVPYIGIFAKVFGEFLEESERGPQRALPAGSGVLSAFLFTRLPLVWGAMCRYSAYRLECGIRSSAILGFIGLPTLGFHLETAFRQGDYAAGAALLYLLLLLIGTLRWWLRGRLLPLYLPLALWWSPPMGSTASGTLARFLTEDIVPAPLRRDEGWSATADWLGTLLWTQGLPGLWQTLVLGTAAMLVTALLALCLMPLVSPLFGNRASRAGGHLLLVGLRSTPEFLLAFIFLLLLGPSMLPGILALALHTGAIIAFLCGRFSVDLRLRPDAARGVERYCWEVLPRLYPNFLAFLLYRWEIIMRETAILGILGITTLGFYVDSAFAEMRLDRAVVLIALGVLLNLGVDALSRGLRAHLRLREQGGRREGVV